MTTTLAQWTVEDYHTMIAAGLLCDRPVELLNGQVVAMSPEGSLHADLNDGLGDWLQIRLQQRARVRDNKPITLDDASEPQSDLAIVRRRSYREAHPRPDDIFWVIELANSSLSKDTEEKALAYAAAGILDYWVINLRTEPPSVIVYRDPCESGYRSQQQFTSGIISPLAFPDIQIELPWLLTTSLIDE